MEFLSTVGFKVNLVITFFYLVCCFLYWGKNRVMFFISSGVFVIAFAGMCIGPYLYDLKGSWRWWLLFSASINFFKILVVHYSERIFNQSSQVTFGIKLALTINMLTSLIVHIDYSILRTDYFIGSYSSITNTINSLIVLVMLTPMISKFFRKSKCLEDKKEQTYGNH